MTNDYDGSYFNQATTACWWDVKLHPNKHSWFVTPTNIHDLLDCIMSMSLQLFGFNREVKIMKITDTFKGHSEFGRSMTRAYCSWQFPIPCKKGKKTASMAGQQLTYTCFPAFSKSFWESQLTKHCGLCRISSCGTFSLPCTNNVWKVWHYVRQRVPHKTSPHGTFSILCQTWPATPAWLAYLENTGIHTWVTTLNMHRDAWDHWDGSSIRSWAPT